jgi:hypothetical protein
VRGDKRLKKLEQAILRQDQTNVLELLAGAPDLARRRLAERAAEERFIEQIRHMVYVGDTVLHLAAACYQPDTITAMVGAGADLAATNRRGAQPLHYAVDGGPGNAHWDAAAQRDTVLCLLRLGADPNALDRNGTAPLHRAVRNRCAAAVKALLDGGADPQATNRSGSTPNQLARWTTGRQGAGLAQAKVQQEEILRLLHGAAAQAKTA